MIILIHGTGDDSTKPENWMSWIGTLMEKYNETALVIPGVASDQQGMLQELVDDFFDKLGDGRVQRYTSEVDIANECPALFRALRAGGRVLAAALNVPAGQEAAIANRLMRRMPEEGGFATSGIKLRIALASLCAVAYYRRQREGHLRPIRIVGHSRGGCVAVGVHNVLSSYGITCHRTLTLDPCHGLRKPIRQKEYHRKIWAGSLINIPAANGVGKDWAGFAVYRPRIAAAGGDAEATNHPKVKSVKHGHMGKLRYIPEGTRKGELRAELARNLQAVVDRSFPDARSHLGGFFAALSLE